MVDVRRFLIPILFLLLLAPVLADGCYRVNAPDTGYAARAANAAQWMGDYYQGESATLLDDTIHDPLAYPAALFYFSRQGLNSLGNQILENEVATATPLDHEGALYLAWLLQKYGDSEFLDASVKHDAQALLDTYVANPPEATSPEEQFEQSVTNYLVDGSGESAVITTLRTTGDDGWPDDIEQSPSRYAKIVTALFALYDEAPSSVTRKLAEMQLDVAFTLYGAAQSGGAWVTPTSDVTFETDAFTPEKSPWAGWGYLLLGTGDSYLTVTEPSAIVSGYSAHEATRIIAAAEERSVREETMQGSLLQSYHTKNYAIGASQDVGGNPFTKPFTYKAWLFMGGETHSFLLLTSRSSDESDASDAETLDRTVLFNKRVMLGSLGEDACHEPHALFGEGFDYSILLNGKGFVFSYGGQIGIISFSYPLTPIQVTERYAPRANKLPTWLTGTLANPVDKEDTGLLLIPDGGSSSGFFSLEMLQSNAKIVQDCGEDIDCIAAAAPGNMSLTVSGNELTYTTKLSGTQHTYTYESGGQAMSGTAPITLNDYSRRHVLGENGYEYLQKGSHSWLLEAPGAGLVHLDFTAATPETMKTIDGYPDDYVCEGDDDELPSAVAGLDELSDLGFAAASFLKHLTNDNHLIDCAEGTTVLPNAAVDPANELVNGACVILTPGEQSVALIWNPDYTAAPVLEAILQNVNNYFPFVESSTGLAVSEADRSICNDASEDTSDSTDFEACDDDLQVANGNKGLPSYANLHLLVNGQEHVLIISTDSNPFTSGWWSDGIGDWWSSLFGNGLISGADPVNVSDFQAAYFYKGGDRSIHALLDRQENGEVLFKNFKQSMEPFASNGQISYDAGGTTQSLRFTSASAEKGTTWSLLTRAFRVDESITGEPFAMETACGNGVVEYGEECDPPGSDVGSCTEGDMTQEVTCSDTCTRNESACGACEDRDGDGEPGPGCDTISEVDCYDASPAERAVPCDDDQAAALGTTCPESVVSCDGFSFGDPACGEYPTTACPQCVRHNDPDNGIQINDICDGVDNDCSGSADPSCSTGVGSNGELWTCQEPIDPCGNICFVEREETPISNPCPTQWEEVKKKGDYTFETRLNEQGISELRITGTQRHIHGAMSCGLCNGSQCSTGETAANNDKKSLTFTAPAPGSASTIFHDGGKHTGRVSLIYTSTPNSSTSPTPSQWKISGELSDATEGTPCWNVTANKQFSLDIPLSNDLCSLDDCPTDWIDLAPQGHYNLSIRWAENGYPLLRIQVGDPTPEGDVDCSAMGVWAVPSPDQEVTFPWITHPDETYGNAIVLFDDGGAHATRITVYSYRDANGESAFRLLAYKVGTEGSSADTAACWGFDNDLLSDATTADFRTIDIFANGMCHKRICQETADCPSHFECAPVSPTVNLCLANYTGLGGACFTPDTPIRLSDGATKPIGQLTVGDSLLGYDESTASVAPTIVEKVLVHPFNRTLIIVNGELNVTPEHLIKTLRGWLPADSLEVGDLLFTPTGYRVVRRIETKAYTGSVYNLHNTPFHNYYADGILVHNKKATGEPLPRTDGGDVDWETFLSYLSGDPFN